MKDETRPAPSWAGDVHDGVDAWLSGRAAEADHAPDRTDRRDRLALPERQERPDRSERPERQGRPGRRGRGRTQRPRRPATDRSAPPPADEAAAGPHADPESVARTILLDQLTGRARSRKELSDKLASREVPDDVATRVLDRFEEVGLVDDDAFARTWVAQRGAGGSSRGLARRALAQELRRKGVDAEVAAGVLDEIDPADEEQTARELVRKKLRTLSRVDDVTATRRLVSLLARKGYPSGLAFAVVREELGASDRHPVGDEALESGDDGL